MIGLKIVYLEPGQFVFGRKVASRDLNIPETTIYRHLEFLKSVGNIDVKTNNKFSIITIINWERYQDTRNQNGQQVENKRTTNGHIQTHKNNKNKEIVEYLNKKSGKNYKPNTNKTIGLIKARHNEGFSILDFKSVIDKKCSDWIGTDMEKFLRPETLFGTKFEGYLNEKPNKPKPNKNSSDAFAV